MSRHDITSISFTSGLKKVQAFSIDAPNQVCVLGVNVFTARSAYLRGRGGEITRRTDFKFEAAHLVEGFKKKRVHIFGLLPVVFFVELAVHHNAVIDVFGDHFRKIRPENPRIDSAHGIERLSRLPHTHGEFISHAFGIGIKPVERIKEEYRFEQVCRRG